jgi:hypothetical protein
VLQNGNLGYGCLQGKFNFLIKFIMSFIDTLQKGEFIALLKATFQEILNEQNGDNKQTKNPKKEYYSLGEVANFLMVTKQTLHNWAKHNLIKKYIIGGRTLLRLKEIVDRMESSPSSFGGNRDYAYRDHEGFNLAKFELRKFSTIHYKIMGKKSISPEEKAFYIDYCNTHKRLNLLDDTLLDSKEE